MSPPVCAGFPSAGSSPTLIVSQDGSTQAACNACDWRLDTAPCGGEGTGKNPCDRAKSGWKWSLAVDRNGIPIGWATNGANRHDSILFEPTLEAVDERGLLPAVAIVRHGLT